MDKTFGPAYDERLDGHRLADQHKRIRNYMLEQSKLGVWLSLEDIEIALDYPQASISAQLRHLRKERFGSYIVNKKRIGGHWEYQVLPPEGTL
jgi:hypothetical protein